MAYSACTSFHPVTSALTSARHASPLFTQPPLTIIHAVTLFSDFGLTHTHAQVKAVIARIRKILRNRTPTTNNGGGGGDDNGDGGGGGSGAGDGGAGGGGGVAELRAMPGWRPLLRAVAPVLFGTPTALEMWLPPTTTNGTRTRESGDGGGARGVSVALLVVDDGVAMPWHQVRV